MMFIETSKHSPATFSLENEIPEVAGGAVCGPLAMGEPWLRCTFSDDGIETNRVGLNEGSILNSIDIDAIDCSIKCRRKLLNHPLEA
jgi:hypothetical protein